MFKWLRRLVPKSDDDKKEEIFLTLVIFYCATERMGLPYDEFLRQITVRYKLTQKTVDSVGSTVQKDGLQCLGPILIFATWTQYGLEKFKTPKRPGTDGVLDEVVRMATVYEELKKRWKTELNNAHLKTANNFNRKRWEEIFSEA